MPPEATIRAYLEQLVPLQEVFDRTRERFQGLRREARSDGINLDALSALLPVLSKYPSDEAGRVLHEVIRYAEVFGAQSPEATAAISDGLVGRSVAETVTGSRSAMKTCPSHEPVRTAAMPVPLKLSTRLVLALSLTAGLIWLLS